MQRLHKSFQKILSDSWTLQEDDKDMIVMHHKFGYEINGEQRQIESSLVVKGENQTYTAMAKNRRTACGYCHLEDIERRNYHSWGSDTD